MYAIFGTLLKYAIPSFSSSPSTFATAASTWAAPQLFGGSIKPKFVSAIVFAALISAVDPVAVLAIFEETQVNDFLSILVSGESLLNDAVSIVLFEGFRELVGESVTFWAIVLLLFDFIIVTTLSTILGYLFAAFGSIVTKYLTRHVHVAETIIVFTTSILSYVTAHILGLSGVVAILTSAIAHNHYTDRNLSGKSLTSSRYLFRALAMVAETVIFVQLGISSIIEKVWKVNFLQLAWVYVTITVVRLAVIIILTWLANLARSHQNQITWRDEFVLAYGGLRGAIAYGLAIDYPDDDPALRNAVIRVTLMIVFMTVFLQGTSMKPVLKLLEIRLRSAEDVNRRESLPVQTLLSAVPHIISGVDAVAGSRPSVLSWLARHDKSIMVRLLTRVPVVEGEAVIQAYGRNLQEGAEEAAQGGFASPALVHRDQPRRLATGYRTSELLGVDTAPQVMGAEEEAIPGPGMPAHVEAVEPSSGDEDYVSEGFGPGPTWPVSQIPEGLPSTPPLENVAAPPPIDREETISMHEEAGPTVATPDVMMAFRMPRRRTLSRLMGTPAPEFKRVH